MKHQSVNWLYRLMVVQPDTVEMEGKPPISGGFKVLNTRPFETHITVVSCCRVSADFNFWETTTN